jgi:hypothetical protein
MKFTRKSKETNNNYNVINIAVNYLNTFKNQKSYNIREYNILCHWIKWYTDNDSIINKLEELSIIYFKTGKINNSLIKHLIFLAYYDIAYHIGDKIPLPLDIKDIDKKDIKKFKKLCFLSKKDKIKL